MTPEDEPTPSDEAGTDQVDTHQVDTDDAPVADPDTVPVDTSPLDHAQDAIDEAREAVQQVAATDLIDDEATGAAELPEVADSTDDTEDS